jgi:hypothetical protein
MYLKRSRFIEQLMTDETLMFRFFPQTLNSATIDAVNQLHKEKNILEEDIQKEGPFAVMCYLWISATVKYWQATRYNGRRLPKLIQLTKCVGPV